MTQNHDRGRGLATALALIAWLDARRLPFAPRDLGRAIVGAGYAEPHRRTVHRWLVALEGARLVERIGQGRYRSLKRASHPEAFFGAAERRAS